MAVQIKDLVAMQLIEKPVIILESKSRVAHAGKLCLS